MANAIGADLNQDKYDESMRYQLYTYDRYEKERADIETTLNIVGYIPGISIATGVVRTLFGLGALIKHVVAAAFYSISDLFMKSPNGYSYRVSKNIKYIGHDIANVFRGLVELLPVVVNNIALICYGSIFGRISYPVEETGVRYPNPRQNHAILSQNA